MCGRFAFFSPVEAIAQAFGVAAPEWFEPRYNIAPTQNVVALLAGADAAPEWRSLRWGLVPFWAKDPAIGNRMINARAETITEKPSYRQPFKRRRCLIAADGFYEWKKTAAGKIPWYISLQSGAPLAFAAIWDSWEKGEGDALQSCSIITAPANQFMAELHHRMPVIIGRNTMSDWLAPDADSARLAARLMLPSRVKLQAWPVSRAVNSPLNDEPALAEPCKDEI
jgi:putative SOS response-associated peptidase YedK